MAMQAAAGWCSGVELWGTWMVGLEGATGKRHASGRCCRRRPRVVRADRPRGWRRERDAVSYCCRRCRPRRWEGWRLRARCDGGFPPWAGVHLPALLPARRSARLRGASTRKSHLTFAPATASLCTRGRRGRRDRDGRRAARPRDVPQPSVSASDCRVGGAHWQLCAVAVPPPCGGWAHHPSPAQLHPLYGDAACTDAVPPPSYHNGVPL